MLRALVSKAPLSFDEGALLMLAKIEGLVREPEPERELLSPEL